MSRLVIPGNPFCCFSESHIISEYCRGKVCFDILSLTRSFHVSAAVVLERARGSHCPSGRSPAQTCFVRRLRATQGGEGDIDISVMRMSSRLCLRFWENSPRGEESWALLLFSPEKSLKTKAKQAAQFVRNIKPQGFIVLKWWLEMTQIIPLSGWSNSWLLGERTCVLCNPDFLTQKKIKKIADKFNRSSWAWKRFDTCQEAMEEFRKNW